MSTCGAVSSELMCDREPGHAGNHRSYRADIDEPVFWPQAMRSETIDTLTERMRWYRDGCDGLEDREGYYASGDCARDAASDLETAISEIRVLESVIAKLRGER